MDKEQLTQQLLTEFKYQAIEQLAKEKIPQEIFEVQLQHLYKFTDNEAKFFVEHLVNALHSVYQDLTKLDKSIILYTLLDLWLEHKLIYNSLEALEQVSNELLFNNEAKSLRGKAELVKATLDVLKFKEDLRHKFLKYVKELVDILVPNQNKPATAPMIMIKFETQNMNQIEVVQDKSILQSETQK